MNTIETVEMKLEKLMYISSNNTCSLSKRDIRRNIKEPVRIYPNLTELAKKYGYRFIISKMSKYILTNDEEEVEWHKSGRNAIIYKFDGYKWVKIQ
jgi:hypothetical protein